MSSSPLPSVNDGPDAAHADFGQWQGDGPSSPQCDGLAPLIDRQTLLELGEDFDDPTVAWDFARDFAQAWEGKYQRLAASVQQRDRSKAKEVALSMKVTSAMVGAVRLSCLATWFEQLIESNDMDVATQTLTCVEACGLETRKELLEAYIQSETATEHRSI